jgi:hypothetical protein
VVPPTGPERGDPSPAAAAREYFRKGCRPGALPLVLRDANQGRRPTRYLTIYRPESGVEGGDPTPEHMAAMMQLIETSTAKGVLISTEPLTPRDKCARLRLSNGEYTVSEETVRAGGFAFLDFASKEAAIEGCKAFLKVAGDGTVEIRQILEFAPQPA